MLGTGRGGGYVAGHQQPSMSIIGMTFSFFFSYPDISSTPRRHRRSEGQRIGTAPLRTPIYALHFYSAWGPALSSLVYMQPMLDSALQYAAITDERNGIAIFSCQPGRLGCEHTHACKAVQTTDAAVQLARQSPSIHHHR